MALYQKLLRREKQGRHRARAVFAKHTAAQIAVEQDLQPDDTVRVALRKSPAAAGKATPALPVTHDFLDVLGAALLNRTRKKGNVAIVWAAQADSAALREALEAARMHKLPMIFLTDTNHPGDRAGAASLLNHEVAPGEEMPHIVVDGNDVLAAYRVAHEALDRARRDRGPTLIECADYRVQGHPRSRHLDPVANLETYLRTKDLLPPRSAGTKPATSEGARKPVA